MIIGRSVILFVRYTNEHGISPPNFAALSNVMGNLSEFRHFVRDAILDTDHLKSNSAPHITTMTHTSFFQACCKDAGETGVWVDN